MIISCLCANGNALATSRPRSPGRPREFDLDQALDQAIAVFSERGYSGASIADLGKAMGLTAGSLYKAFADKQALFVAAFERYTALRLAKLDEAQATAPTGRERLRQVLVHYVVSSSGAEGRRGCLIDLLPLDSQLLVNY